MGMGFRRLVLALLLADAVAFSVRALAQPQDVAPSFYVQYVELTLSNQRKIMAEVRVPELEKGERVPAVLLFGGFQNAGRVLDLVKPNRKVIHASFDYPFTPPRKFDFPGSFSHAPEAKRMIHDTVEGIRVLSGFLTRHPNVAPEKTIAIGASLGAPFCIGAAANNSNIDGLVLVHGFGSIPKTIAHQFKRAWNGKWGGAWNWLAGPLASLLGYGSWAYVGISSPEDFAAELLPEQRVFLISAVNDSFVPAEARESLWRAVARSPAQVEAVLMPGDHLQPGAEQLISELMEKVWSWSDKAGFSPDSERAPPTG